MKAEPSTPTFMLYYILVSNFVNQMLNVAWQTNIINSINLNITKVIQTILFRPPYGFNPCLLGWYALWLIYESDAVNFEINTSIRMFKYV